MTPFRHLLTPLLLLLFLPAQPLSAADAPRTPLRHGFNLLERFQWNPQADGEYREADFAIIHDWGFNFVRLPMDYRFWIKNNDWTQIDDARLAGIDRAVAYGRQYGIHVCLNFHRAPGYSVNTSVREPASLWTDPEALRVCTLHWAHFARRYRDIPPEALSFNLLNEPAGVDAATCSRVCRALIAAIRAEDPDRPIMVDGLDWGSKPVPDLDDLAGVVHAGRGYFPMSVTHYRAEWTPGQTATPCWPPLPVFSPWYGRGKPDWQSPLVLRGAFAPGELRLETGRISAAVRLRVLADDAPIHDTRYDVRPGPGWTNLVHQPQWSCWQGERTEPIRITLPHPCTTLTLAVEDGDWMTVDTLVYTEKISGRSARIVFSQEWGRRQGAPLRWNGFDAAEPFSTDGAAADALLRERLIVPWSALRARGIPVMVGEFGAYNKTPHPIVLRWMEDCLRLWQTEERGWALWNLRGSFGVLDSDRTDVAYENFRGHKLDREMLDLLRRYAKPR